MSNAEKNWAKLSNDEPHFWNRFCSQGKMYHCESAMQFAIFYQYCISLAVNHHIQTFCRNFSQIKRHWPLKTCKIVSVTWLQIFTFADISKQKTNHKEHIFIPFTKNDTYILIFLLIWFFRISCCSIFKFIFPLKKTPERVVFNLV